MQYFADTSSGAWAELLRHEEIYDAIDLAGISARLWAIHIPDQEARRPELSDDALKSSPDGYEICQQEARRLRASGARRLAVVSAALKSGEAAGFRVGTTGLNRAAPREGQVIVHFGELPDAEGWSAAEAARPSVGLLDQIRPLYPT